MFLFHANMRLGISKKYTTFIILLNFTVLTVLLLSTAIVILRGADALRNEMREGVRTTYYETHHGMIRNLSEYLRRDLFNPLYQLDITRINQMINDFRKGIPIKSFRIADPSGIVLTDGTKENLSYGDKLKIDTERLKSSPISIQKAGERYAVTFLIEVEGYAAGYGEIIFSEDPFRRAIERQDETVLKIWQDFKRKFLNIAIAGIFFTALITISLGLLISKRLSLPLVKLSEAAKGIAEGDMNHRVKFKSKDEVGELADSFNMMADKLQKTLVSREEIIKERDKSQRYLDIAGVMILVIGADERVTLINKKGCEILGYKEDEIIGKNWFDNFIPERMRKEIRGVFAKCLSGEIEPVKHYENPVLTSSGNERVITWHNSILNGGNGNIAGILSSGEDITKLKKHVKELENINQLSIGRELRMIELKREVNELLRAKGEKEKYEVVL